jgi:hypothetical protein
MDKSMYELIAYVMRYWFGVLMLVILWRAVHWIRYEADVKAIEKKMLPDAGFIGEWVVLYGADKMEEGTMLNAPGDGFLGSGRTCDVRIPVKGLPKRAARFYFRRDGLHLLPYKEGTIKVDGRPVRQEAVLRHGATLSVEGIVLQFRLFAGILLTGEAVIEPMEMEMPEETPPFESIGMETEIFGHSEEEAIELPKPAFQIVGRRRRGRNIEKRTPDA